jgi:hypothetical protein
MAQQFLEGGLRPSREVQPQDEGTVIVRIPALFNHLTRPDDKRRDVPEQRCFYGETMKPRGK